jgi:hypothetical protein
MMHHFGLVCAALLALVVLSMTICASLFLELCAVKISLIWWILQNIIHLIHAFSLLILNLMEILLLVRPFALSRWSIGIGRVGHRWRLHLSDLALSHVFVTYLCDLRLIAINEVVAFDLHLLEHLFQILVIHWEFTFLSILSSPLLADHRLVLRFVVGALVSLMASSANFLASISLVLAAIGHHILCVSPAFDLFLRVVPFVRLQIEVYGPLIHRVVFDDFPNDSSYVVLVSHPLQKRSDSIQLRITHIIVPAGARDRVLRLE